MRSLWFSHREVFIPPDEYDIHLNPGHTLEARFETIGKDLSQHVRRRDIATYHCILSALIALLFGKGSESPCRFVSGGLCIGWVSVVFAAVLLSIYPTL